MKFSIFSCNIVHLHIFFWDMCNQNLCPLKKNGIFVFLLLSSLYILDIRLWLDLQIFLPFCELSFQFFDGALWSTTVFNFNKAQLITFFLLSIVLLVSYIRNLSQPMVTKIYCCILFYGYFSFSFYT